MAWFGKKKKEENTTPEVQENAAEEVSADSILDAVKEGMEEAKAERYNQMAQETAEAQAAQQQAAAANEMPTADEIRKAQEILARAQAAQANTIPTGAKVGVNAPVNSANLKSCITNFIASKTQENLKLVMDCLQKPETLICVPAQIITSPENQEKMKQGGQVQLDGPIHINPIILTDNNGKKVFPIFSSEETIPDEIKSKTPKVNMPLGHALNIMKGIKDVDTFALDPYTANIRIGVNVEQKPKQ